MVRVVVVVVDWRLENGAMLTKPRVSSRVQAALIAPRAGLLTHPDGMP